MYKVLLVDDDSELCEMLKEYLEAEDFNIITIHDGASGLEKAKEENFDLIVLDVMIPSLNGFSLLKEIRKTINTPILMLTARGDEVDKIMGLEMGADDYLPKPFSLRELTARLRALVRRNQYNESNYIDNVNKIKTGELEIFPSSREAIYKSQPLLLTSSEYNILELLAKNTGKLVDKEVISEIALGKQLTDYDRSIDMHISKLRYKLFDESQQLIQTVRGKGYQLSNKK